LKRKKLLEVGGWISLVALRIWNLFCSSNFQKINLDIVLSNSWQLIFFITQLTLTVVVALSNNWQLMLFYQTV